MVSGDRGEVIGALLAHPWPAGWSIGLDADVLRFGAAPLGLVDLAVISGIALGIPAIVVALSPTILGVIAAVLFTVAVVAVGYQRFRGARRVTVDFASERVHVDHANPRAARRVGPAARTFRFADVASIDVTRVLMGSRTEPLGRRVAARLDDGGDVILAEFADAATALTFARALGGLFGAPTEQR